jgi:hypothetical protein
MTETEWLQSDDPAAMLAAVVDRTLSGRERLTNRVSDRKLRLFACACLEIAKGPDWEPLESFYKRAEDNEGWADVANFGHHRCSAIEQATAWVQGHPEPPTTKERAALLREIVGNPWKPVRLCGGREFDCWLCKGTGGTIAVDAVGLEHGRIINPRPAVCMACNGARKQTHDTEVPCTLCKDILSWQNGEIPRLAQSIHDRRAFDELPILADALTEAGCDSEELLMHLRGMEQVPITPEVTERTGSQARTMLVPLRGPHVRGCWCVDLILGQS